MNGYGAPMMYGVPQATWLSWDAHTQELWLQDYNRTEEQANYYKDSDQAKVFAMKSYVDDIAADTKTYAGDVYGGAIDFGERALLLGAGALALILLLK